MSESLWDDDVIHCGHNSGAETSLCVSVSSLFYHFRCLQLLALIKKKPTHNLIQLH